MILADSPVIEIAAGTVDDSEAQEVLERRKHSANL